MLLDYELAISGALGALVILRLVHLRREWRKVREKLDSITTATGDLRDAEMMAKRGGKHNSQSSPAGTPSLFADRLIICLLVIALLWFGGRIWMQY